MQILSMKFVENIAKYIILDKTRAKLTETQVLNK